MTPKCFCIYRLKCSRAISGRADSWEARFVERIQEIGELENLGEYKNSVNSKRVKEQVKIEKICALLCPVWSQAFVLNHWERGKF